MQGWSLREIRSQFLRLYGRKEGTGPSRAPEGTVPSNPEEGQEDDGHRAGQAEQQEPSQAMGASLPEMEADGLTLGFAR